VVEVGDARLHEFVLPGSSRFRRAVQNLKAEIVVAFACGNDAVYRVEKNVARGAA
jgi:hypothetical protein